MKKKLPKKLIFFILGVLFFIFFVYFTFIVKLKILNQFDFDTTVRIQNHLSKRFDTILSIFSLLGSFELLIVILLILLILRKKLLGALVAIIFLSIHVLEIFGKTYLNHPGPPFMFFRYNLPFFFPSSYVKPGSSYPSGHTFRSVFVFMVASYVIFQSKKFSTKMKFILNGLLLALLSFMLFSRVSLGEHWSTDVLGGALLGIASGFFSLIFL